MQGLVSKEPRCDCGFEVWLWRGFSPSSGGVNVTAKVDSGWLDREVSLTGSLFNLLS